MKSLSGDDLCHRACSQPGIPGGSEGSRRGRSQRERGSFLVGSQLLLCGSVSGQRTPAPGRAVADFCLLRRPLCRLWQFLYPAGYCSLFWAYQGCPGLLVALIEGVAILHLPKDAPGSQAGRHFLHLYFSRHLLSVLFPIITRLPLWLLLRQGINIVPLVPAGRGCPGSGSDPAGAPQAVPPTRTSGAGRWELALLVPCYQHPCQSRALTLVLDAWLGDVHHPMCHRGSFLPRRLLLTALLQGCLETWLEGRDLRGHSGCSECTSSFRQAAARQSSASQPE